MRILIGDYETDMFRYDADENYQINDRFVCFKDIESQEKWFFNIEQEGNQQVIDFINNISGIKKPCRIYFHNLNFDIVFLQKLLRKDCNYAIIRNGSQILQFKLYRQYKTKLKDKKGYRIINKTILDIRNSISLFPTALKNLGVSVGLPKIEQDYTSEIDEQYIEYCYRDLEIVELALKRLISDIKRLFDYDLKLSRVPLTAPALVKQVFHHIIKKEFGNDIINKIYDLFRNDYQDKMRIFYFGGRVEVFDFNQCNNGHYNDINSCYPYEMFRNEFPLAPYTMYKCDFQDDCWNQWKKNKLFFGAICKVYENDDIPLIPVRLENNKILYPTGWKLSFLFRKEIDCLIEKGSKIHFLKLFKCSEYKPIFRTFVEKTYYERKKFAHNTFENLLLKLLMNSLYGKFAEKTEKEIYEIIHDIKNIPKNELELCEIIENRDGTHYFIKTKSKENPNLKINIFFSMMITALARLNLTGYIWKSAMPIYCDSDSVVSQNLIEKSDDLGKMKSEFQFSRFQALSCKEYIYEKQLLLKFGFSNMPYIENIHNKNNVKMKGFGKIKADNFNNFIVNYREGKKQHRLVGFFESIKHGINNNTVLVYDKFKNQSYDKRWILPDFTTKPFDIDNDDFKELKENNEFRINQIIERYKNESV